MIKGIGVDIVDMSRIQLNERFIDKILTEEEIHCLNGITREERKIEYLAGRFAAKEAYTKALGTGFTDIGFHDIEVLNDLSGKPYLNIEHTHISLSHDGNLAIAFVIIEE